MSASEHLQWALAVLMLAVAAYHAARLVHRARGRNSGRIDVELTHFAMGIAMAAMLVATLPPLAGRFLAGAFLLVLGWFLANAIHSFIWAGAAAAASPAQQVPICAGMVYMLFAPFVTRPADARHGTRRRRAAAAGAGPGGRRRAARPGGAASAAGAVATDAPVHDAHHAGAVLPTGDERDGRGDARRELI